MLLRAFLEVCQKLSVLVLWWFFVICWGSAKSKNYRTGHEEIHCLCSLSLKPMKQNLTIGGEFLSQILFVDKIGKSAKWITILSTKTVLKRTFLKIDRWTVERLPHLDLWNENFESLSCNELCLVITGGRPPI